MFIIDELLEALMYNNIVYSFIFCQFGIIICTLKMCGVFIKVYFLIYNIILLYKNYMRTVSSIKRLDNEYINNIIRLDD